MADASFIRLMSWLSPVFPTGGFAYSAGLESAVAYGLVAISDELQAWLATQLQHGSIRNEGILLKQAHEACQDKAALDGLSDLAEALAESAERHAETLAQGKSFVEAARHWPDVDFPDQQLALPVAIGSASGQGALAVSSTLQAWFNAFLTNQLQVAIRLSVTGQNGAATILAELEPIVIDLAQQLSTARLDDLGSSTFNGAIASMQHETLQPRLFLS